MEVNPFGRTSQVLWREVASFSQWADTQDFLLSPSTISPIATQLHQPITIHTVVRWYYVLASLLDFRT